MRKVAHIMGMAITVDIPVCDNTKIFESTFDRIKEIDRKFSTYKQDSELSKYQRGELEEKDLSNELKKIMLACKDAQKLTDGYFSAYFSKKFDPTGYVKGYAIDQVSKFIEKQGYQTYCIGAGGDILARSNGKKVWDVGIQDPKNKSKLIGKISAKNFAVATSGNYERGKHIINPKTGDAADDLLSITVWGPEIIKTDVFATAIFAEGLSGLIMAEESEGYEAMAIDKNGDFYMTSGMGPRLKLSTA